MRLSPCSRSSNLFVVFVFGLLGVRFRKAPPNRDMGGAFHFISPNRQADFAADCADRRGYRKIRNLDQTKLATDGMKPQGLEAYQFAVWEPDAG